MLLDFILQVQMFLVRRFKFAYCIVLLLIDLLVVTNFKFEFLIHVLFLVCTCRGSEMLPMVYHKGVLSYTVDRLLTSASSVIASRR